MTLSHLFATLLFLQSNYSLQIQNITPNILFYLWQSNQSCSLLWRGLGKKKASCCLSDRILQTTLIPQQLSCSCPGKQTSQATNQPIISLSQRQYHAKGWFHSITQTVYSQTLENVTQENTLLTYCVSGQMIPRALVIFAEKA